MMRLDDEDTKNGTEETKKLHLVFGIGIVYFRIKYIHFTGLERPEINYEFKTI